MSAISSKSFSFKPRVVHAADATGRAVENTLEGKVRRHPNIQLFENHLAVDLITKAKLGRRGDNRCLGLYVLDKATGQVEVFAGRFVILATGGASKAYLYSSNPDTSTGDGIAMIHAGGTIMQFDLQAGQMLKLDTGCLVALTPSVRYDIEFVGGLKNTLFGGEGLFLANVAGPGRVWLQTLPFSRLAGRIIAAAPGAGSGGKDEGSLLGGIGNMIMGGNQ